MSNIVAGLLRQKNLNISFTDKAVILLMADFSSDDGSGIWASKVTMAKQLETTDRTIRRAIDRLKEAGFVREIGSKKNNNGFTVEYAIDVQRVHSCPDISKKPLTKGQVSPPETTPDTPSPLTERQVTPDTPSPQDLTQGQVNLPLTIHEPSNIPPLIPPIPSFEEIWEHYPRRVGKGAAEKAWNKAIKAHDPQTILPALGNYCRAMKGTDQQFIPHLATWLNQKRWEDDQSHATNRPRTSRDDLEHLSRMQSSQDDITRLMAPQLKVIGQ